MKPNRTNELRTGKRKSIRTKSQTTQVSAVEHAVVLIDTVCVIAGSEDLIAAPNDRSSARLRSAITRHDTALLFDRLIEAFSFQGISDQVALTYMNQHGRVRWRDIERTLAGSFGCTKLQSYWAFHSCVRRDNQGENPATIRMRMRRCWGDEGRAEPDRRRPSSGGVRP